MWDYRQLFIIRDSCHDGLIVQMQPVYCVVHVDPAQQSFVLCSSQGPSLGWSALHTNTLLYATNSAAELLNMSAEIPVPYKSIGVLLLFSMGSGACALLDAHALSGNTRFENVAAICKFGLLSFSGSICLCIHITVTTTSSIISPFQRPACWPPRLQSI